MKAKMLKGIVTLEMPKEEAIALVMALKNTVWQIIDEYRKYHQSGAWDDLAVLGKTKDEMDRLLKAPPLEGVDES